MQRMLRLIPIGLYCAAIFLLSSLPEAPDAVSWIPDKVGHVVLYAGLGWLVSREMRQCSVSAPHWLVLTATLFCLGYGLTDEVHQYFVPGRSFEVGDLAADAVGGCIGGALYVAWVRKMSLVDR